MLPLLVASCTARLPDLGTVPPGDYVGYLESREEDWRRRSYRLHVPPGPSEFVKRPVVVILHGAFSSARGIEKRSGFNRLADEEGFVAVYPNGYGFLGLLRHWNAEHCCGRARRLGLDDVGFLDSVLDDATRRVNVDPTRVYVVGESNGGMLAHLYAAARSRRVAGAAVVIGTIGSGAGANLQRIAPPAEPVPMTIVHGAADRIIPFHGGPSERDPGTNWVSTPESAAFWVVHNHLHAEAESATLYGGRVLRSTWRGGDTDAPVVLYEIRDWPHSWPGPASIAALAADDPLREFDAARVLWQHLRRHSRAVGAP